MIVAAVCCTSVPTLPSPPQTKELFERNWWLDPIYVYGFKTVTETQ
jgi:hypothetical protein